MTAGGGHWVTIDGRHVFIEDGVTGGGHSGNHNPMTQTGNQHVDFVLYHGTKANFNEFDLRKAGASDPGLVGKAVYLTPTKEQAASFATSRHYGKGQEPAVLTVSAQIKNPAVFEEGKLPDGRSLSQVYPHGITKEQSRQLQNSLKKQGHDAVVFKTGGEVVQVAVFNPKNVKVLKRQSAA